MMLSIGVASYGFAELMASRIFWGFSFLVPAMFLASLTRPHVAGMVAIAMVVPYLFNKGRGGTLSVSAKIIGIPVVGAGVVYLTGDATTLLSVDSTIGGVARIEKLGETTMRGGSAFGAGQSSFLKVLLSPFLMFRPFPWEIPNPMALAATLEALLLLYFLWCARHRLTRMLLCWRDHPFLYILVLRNYLLCRVFAGA